MTFPRTALLFLAACAPVRVGPPNPSGATSATPIEIRPLPAVEPPAVEPPAPPLPAGDAPSAFTPAPPGATVQVFRASLVGWLPAPARRNTWQLVRAGTKTFLRFEAQFGVKPLHDINYESHQRDAWSPPQRVEWQGDVIAGPTTKITVTRAFGADAIGPDKRTKRTPARLALACTTKSVRVHPAFARLVQGWKNNDDSMEPPSWAPTRTEEVSAFVCHVSYEDPDEALELPFDTGDLVFANGKSNAKEETVGVEWAFVNSDMVIQNGGYRWIPSFAFK